MKHLLTISWLWITLTFVWDAPLTNTDGSPAVIHHYNIYRKFHGCGWNKGHVAERTVTTYQWDIPPNDIDGKPNINVYDWAVTAVGPTGLESVKSNVVVINTNKNPPWS